MNESGISLKDISNKQFSTIQTDKAENIIKGLELSGIPYHAKYSDSTISIAFCGDDKEKVEQIIKKNININSESIKKLESFKSKPDNIETAKTLLTEIANILNVSVSSLKKKPSDLIILLAQTYTIYNCSDDLTLKNALKNNLYINYKINK